MTGSRTELDERFDGDALDTDVWFPYYLPHWGSRAGSEATWAVDDEGLHVRIPADQPTWNPDLHAEPLRVSCLQSGSFAGPPGSGIGQQPFSDGLVVREEQPTFWGYTPRYGHLEVTMRGVVTRRSMVAFWLSGIEDLPERSGEICVAEIFGDAIHDGVTEVGMGVKAFRDPALRQQFATEPLAIDVADLHTYGVDWAPGSLAFSVDGRTVRRLDQSPDYPVQLMLGVFDFPAKAAANETAVPVPELVVTRVVGRPLGRGDA